MKLQVLVDNNTYIDHYYLGEPGVSYYVEIDDKKILFDAGYSDIMIRNAHSLGVDLKKITHILIRWKKICRMMRQPWLSIICRII